MMAGLALILGSLWALVFWQQNHERNQQLARIADALEKKDG